MPTLVEARAFLDRFHAMICRKTSDLDGWVADATGGLLAPFAAEAGPRSTCLRLGFSARPKRHQRCVTPQFCGNPESRFDAV